MKRIVYTALVVLFVVGLLVPVPVPAAESHIQNYLSGLESSKNGEFEEAVSFFDKAIASEGKEQKKVRLYGMRFGEYFPHLQKGIALYNLHRFDESKKELEVSLDQVDTDDGEKYLALVNLELRTKGAGVGVTKSVETPEELKKLPAAKDENRYAVAVIIGNRDYKNPDVPPVDFAIEDARLIREALINTMGYREGNIIFEKNATKGTLENIFGSSTSPKGRLAQYIEPGKSDLFIYYSGHGAPSLDTRKGYILPTDSDPNNVAVGGYALDTLYNNLASLKFKSLTVVTDACFSGAPLFKKASPVGIIVENPLAVMKDTIIFNSSSGTQLSSWYPEKGHGLYTYFFLLGMTGKADSDANKKITAGELADYIEDNVPYMARSLYEGRRQTPIFTMKDRNKVLATYR